MSGGLPEIRSYRDLIVWQKSMTLVKGVYRASGRFPDDERYGLTSQLRRCAVSIPSNIAEGYGRQSTTDYLRFLKISVGSLYELQTQLEIASMLEYLMPEEASTLQADSQEIERMLNSLIRKIGNSRR